MNGSTENGRSIKFIWTVHFGPSPTCPSTWASVWSNLDNFFIKLNQNEDFRSQLIDSMLFGADRPKDQKHDPVDDYFLDF